MFFYVFNSVVMVKMFFFFSSRRRHTSFKCDWSSDVCSSDLATSATAKRVERRRATSLLLGVIGRGLRRRRTTRWKRIAEREMHHRDLLLLIDDDLLGKPLQALVPSVAQLGDRHVDGTLVVRDHHACEVAVRTAREGHVHRRMHAGSRALDDRLEPGAPGRGLAVRGSAREGESENRGEREGRRLPENRLESGGHVQLQSDHLTTTATNVNTATDQLFAKIVRRRSCERKGVRVQSGGKAMPEPVATVFVVDDDASIREALASLVRSAGLKAETFATAQEFLARAPADAPSCLVLDVRMPGLSGLDLQSRMRELNLEIPVVFITGHGDVPTSVRAMKAGALEFLTKPVLDEELLDAIARAIVRDRAIRRRQAEIGELNDRYGSLTPR